MTGSCPIHKSGGISSSGSTQFTVNSNVPVNSSGQSKLFGLTIPFIKKSCGPLSLHKSETIQKKGFTSAGIGGTRWVEPFDPQQGTRVVLARRESVRDTSCHPRLHLHKKTHRKVMHAMYSIARWRGGVC